MKKIAGTPAVDAYPFFHIAKKYDVSYGMVLQLTEAHHGDTFDLYDNWTHQAFKDMCAMAHGNDILMDIVRAKRVEYQRQRGEIAAQLLETGVCNP